MKLCFGLIKEAGLNINNLDNVLLEKAIIYLKEFKR